MKQRLRVLAFIKAEVEAGRPFPKYSAIRDHMGWKNSSSVPDALWALVKDGRLVADFKGPAYFRLKKPATGGSSH